MAGRPERKFSDEQVQQITQMALDNCHFDTIALALNIPVSTLKRHYERVIKQKRAEGRTILRRSQHEKAIIGKDTAMLCFLGKNELGQSDKQEFKHDVTKELGQLLGLVDGKSKSTLPDRQEKAEEAK